MGWEYGLDRKQIQDLKKQWTVSWSAGECMTDWDGMGWDGIG